MPVGRGRIRAPSSCWWECAGTGRQPWHSWPAPFFWHFLLLNDWPLWNLSLRGTSHSTAWSQDIFHCPQKKPCSPLSRPHPHLSAGSKSQLYHSRENTISATVGSPRIPLSSEPKNPLAQPPPDPSPRQTLRKNGLFMTIILSPSSTIQWQSQLSVLTCSCPLPPTPHETQEVNSGQMKTGLPSVIFNLGNLQK